MSDSRVTGRVWRPDWRLLLFSGLLLPLLIGLGIWQLDRAGQKEALLARWQRQAETQPWAALMASSPASEQPVRVTGHYGSHSWLLDNRTRDGRPGYEVITVFMPVEGPKVLVNRGWVPAPERRSQLPAIQTPHGLVTLSGRLSGYPVPPVLGAESEGGDQWPRRVQALPEDRASEVAGPLAGMIIRLDDQPQPGAYRADWAPDLMGPGTHYGYAAQWFTMAFVLVVLTVVASFRKTGADNDNDNG
ncbi:MAG: SURF1 family protein [Marinobacter sp.]|nr:SURF1 family protein [Marinobacter sp.]